MERAMFLSIQILRIGKRAKKLRANLASVAKGASYGYS